MECHKIVSGRGASSECSLSWLPSGRLPLASCTSEQSSLLFCPESLSLQVPVTFPSSDFSHKERELFGSKLPLPSEVVPSLQITVIVSCNEFILFLECYHFQFFIMLYFLIK